MPGGIRISGKQHKLSLEVGMKAVFVVPLRMLVVALGMGLLIGCSDSSTNAHSNKKSTVFNPPNMSFARAVGVTSGPITEQQARAIAEAATGGTAISVEQEDMDGMQVFGVLVQVGPVRKDVKVRISDGAVLQIDIDDGIEGGERED